MTRVVVAIEDPNPSVSGQGIALLRSAGIAVEVGVLADQAEQHLAGFLLRMRRGWGQITLKVAASLDGRVAKERGTLEFKNVCAFNMKQSRSSEAQSVLHDMEPTLII